MHYRVQSLTSEHSNIPPLHCALIIISPATKHSKTNSQPWQTKLKSPEQKPRFSSPEKKKKTNPSPASAQKRCTPEPHCRAQRIIACTARQLAGAKVARGRAQAPSQSANYSRTMIRARPSKLKGARHREAEVRAGTAGPFKAHLVAELSNRTRGGCACTRARFWSRAKTFQTIRRTCSRLHNLVLLTMQVRGAACGWASDVAVLLLLHRGVFGNDVEVVQGKLRGDLGYTGGVFVVRRDAMGLVYKGHLCTYLISLYTDRWTKWNERELF